MGRTGAARCGSVGEVHCVHVNIHRLESLVAVCHLWQSLISTATTNLIILSLISVLCQTLECDLGLFELLSLFLQACL